jgi:hypothetical protein
VSALRDHLHPEFGFAAPSLGLRKRVRIAAVSAVIGALIGVIGGASGTALLMTGRGHVDELPNTAFVEAPHPAPANAAAQPPLAPLGSPQAGQQEPTLEATHAQTPCEKADWIRLEGKCLPAPRTRRVLVGVSEPQPQPRGSVPAPAAAGTERRESATRAAAPAAAGETVGHDSVTQPPAPRAKRGRTAARNQQHRRSRHVPRMRPGPPDEFWNARAGVAHRGYGPNSYFERSWDWER